MKSKQWGHKTLAAMVGIGATAGLVSCGTSNTVDYLYATSARNNPGQINVFRVDSQSGALTQIPDSPYNAGRDPVSLVIDSTGKNLYVANNIDNSIVQFSIGTDAKLYGQHTINTPGSEPVWLAIRSNTDSNGNLTGGFLFVVDNLQPGFTDANRSPGALFVYTFDKNGVLSATPVTQTVNGAASQFVPLGNNPTAANAVLTGNYVYVSSILATGQTGASSGGSCSAGQGQLQGYGFDGNGVLTPVPGSPFCAGTTPSALASNPLGTFLYATDSSQNQVIQYNITNTGALTTRPNPLVATGTAPAGIVVDQRGQYVYVSNRSGQSVSGYAIDAGTGALSALATGGTVATQTQPTCIIVEPALARFVYTSNFVDGTINGFRLDPNTGGLSATQGTFYNGAGLATCLAATVHGNHPVITTYNTAQ